MLRKLIRGQVAFVLTDRTLAQVYHNEITNLPSDDRHRLRRKQRMYLEEWVHVLAVLRPETSDAELRALAHAAIGGIQSTLFYPAACREEQLAELLCASAEAVLFSDTGRHERGRPHGLRSRHRAAALRAAVMAITRTFGGAYYAQHAEAAPTDRASCGRRWASRGSSG